MHQIPPIRCRERRLLARLKSRLVMIGGSQAFPQGLQLVPKGRPPGVGLTPTRPYPIPPQQAVLLLRQLRKRHEQDPLCLPAGLGGDGEDLGGYEAGLVAGRGFFPHSMAGGAEGELHPYRRIPAGLLAIILCFLRRGPTLNFPRVGARFCSRSILLQSPTPLTSW
jgi:hypothetical protein